MNNMIDLASVGLIGQKGKFGSIVQLYYKMTNPTVILQLD
jgi:hypothetical protein